MHPELSQPGKLVQTAYLNVPIETAWQLLTKPSELTRWRGEDLQRVETGRSQGEPFVLYYRGKETQYTQVGKILHWEPPYQLIYSYWHSRPGKQNLPQQFVTLIFQLTSLPKNKAMLYLTQTGFYEPSSFEQADQYWRTAFAQLRWLQAIGI